MTQKIGGYKVHPAAEAYPLLEGEDFDALCEDIRDHGLLNAIVITRDDELLDGRNRIRACLKVGVDVRFDYYGGNEPAHYVVSINGHRRHLSASQKAMAAAALKPMLAEEAQARILAGKAAEPEDGPGGNSSTGSGKSRDQAGAVHGVSGRYVDKAEKVLNEGTKELIEAVRAGLVKVELAEKLAKRPEEEQREVIAKIKAEAKKNPKAIVRRHDKDKVIERIKGETYPLPEGPFRVIEADIAWQYDKRPDDATQRGQTPYPTMTIEEIIQLGEQVEQRAHQDCILWLWTTNAHMPVAVEVVKAWGFAWKTILTWEKTQMGTGDWLRGITEHCIMAVRGKPVVDLTNQTTHFRAPARRGEGGHSKKPDEFYEIVESLCPGAKLSMFATGEREGWTSWGLGASWSAEKDGDAA